MEDFIVSISSIMIDDVIYSIENMRFGNLGGASLHAIAGCGVWDRFFGVISSVGKDFKSYSSDLRHLNIDLQAIQILQEKTTRVWEIYQQGNQRVMVFQDPEIGIVQPVPDFEILPRKYQKAKGYHILWNGDNQDLIRTLEWIRKKNPETVIALEPSRVNVHQSLDFYKHLFPLIDVFSPGLSEISISGIQTDLDGIFSWFMEQGCKRLVLRMGSDGSIGAEHTDRFIKVPAVKTHVTDVTGAGNAYLGGLLSGLAKKLSLEESMAMGSVSAGFKVQTFGLCRFHGDMILERDAFLREVLEGINIVNSL